MVSFSVLEAQLMRLCSSLTSSTEATSGGKKRGRDKRGVGEMFSDGF